MTSIKERAAQVRNEARYVGGQNESNYLHFSALFAMNAVNSNLSAAKWGHEAKQGNFTLPKTIKDAWERNIGICGTQTAAFMMMMEELDIPSRDVQLYWIAQDTGLTNNHVFPEVFWGGKWRMFDVTYGWYPHTMGDRMDAVSFEDFAKQNSTYEILSSDALPWTFHYTRRVDIYEPYKVPLLGQLVNGAGRIYIPSNLKEDGKILTFNLTSLPTAVGDVASYSGKPGRLSFILALPKGNWDIEIALGHSNAVLEAKPAMTLKSATGSDIAPTSFSAEKITFSKCNGSLQVEHNVKSDGNSAYTRIKAIVATSSSS